MSYDLVKKGTEVINAAYDALIPLTSRIRRVDPVGPRTGNTLEHLFRVSPKTIATYPVDVLIESGFLPTFEALVFDVEARFNNTVNTLNLTFTQNGDGYLSGRLIASEEDWSTWTYDTVQLRIEHSANEMATIVYRHQEVTKLVTYKGIVAKIGWHQQSRDFDTAWSELEKLGNRRDETIHTPSKTFTNTTLIVSDGLEVRRLISKLKKGTE